MAPTLTSGRPTRLGGPAAANITESHCVPPPALVGANCKRDDPGHEPTHGSPEVGRPNWSMPMPLTPLLPKCGSSSGSMWMSTAAFASTLPRQPIFTLRVRLSSMRSRSFRRPHACELCQELGRCPRMRHEGQVRAVDFPQSPAGRRSRQHGMAIETGMGPPGADECARNFAASGWVVVRPFPGPASTVNNAARLKHAAADFYDQGCASRLDGGGAVDLVDRGGQRGVELGVAHGCVRPRPGRARSSRSCRDWRPGGLQASARV